MMNLNTHTRNTPIHLRLARLVDELIQINSFPEFEQIIASHPNLKVEIKQSIDAVEKLWWHVRQLTAGSDASAIAPQQLLTKKLPPEENGDI